MTSYDPNATPWNDGTPWSEMDIIDLKHGLEQGSRSKRSPCSFSAT